MIDSLATAVLEDVSVIAGTLTAQSGTDFFNLDGPAVAWARTRRR
jgi:hypothetical protein